MTLSRKWLEIIPVMVLALMTTVIFWDGQYDISLASFFYYPSNIANAWPIQNFWLWNILYTIARPLTFILAIAALTLVIVSFFNSRCAKFRQRAAYFFLVIILGPVVVVNLVLKDNWGRPRPRDIIEFSGQYQYQPATVMSDTGKKSFVCGHCASAYIYFSAYFILSKGRILALLLTLCYSFLMGLTRMSAGGHFMSDIIWSGCVMFFLCWFLYYFVFKSFTKDSSG